jgi:hypothetical protein
MRKLLEHLLEAAAQENISIKEIATHLKELLAIQGEHGNWNANPYMFGLYNGLALALSVITYEEPQFRDAPEKWTSETNESKKKLPKLLQEAIKKYSK